MQAEILPEHPLPIPLIKGNKSSGDKIETNKQKDNFL